MAAIRYLVQRLGGADHGMTLEAELPLTGVRRGRALSAPPTASGKIDIPLPRLVGPDGLPIIRKWRTAIFPIEDDILRGGYVVTNVRPAGQEWEITMAGFTAYAVGQPFSGAKEYVNADPMNIFRDIWSDLQNQPDGNIGLMIGDAVSTVRVGSPPRQVEFTTGAGEDVAFEADDQARKLNWWSTFDCGRELDNLAAETPFDWRERHEWNDNAPGGISHYVDLGYPSLGVRKTLPRLVYGENVHTPPSAADNPEYATDVVVLGAGEGKDRVRGYAGTERQGLRRTKVVEDADVTSNGQAYLRAVEELAKTRERFIVESAVVERHPNADIDALEPGDEVRYYAETESGIVLDQWVKIVNIEAEDDDPSRVTVTMVTA